MLAEKLAVKQVGAHTAAVYKGQELLSSLRLETFRVQSPDCFLVSRSSFIQLIVFVVLFLRKEKLNTVLV